METVSRSGSSRCDRSESYVRRGPTRQTASSAGWFLALEFYDARRDDRPAQTDALRGGRKTDWRHDISLRYGKADYECGAQRRSTSVRGGAGTGRATDYHHVFGKMGHE